MICRAALCLRGEAVLKISSQVILRDSEIAVTVKLNELIWVECWTDDSEMKERKCNSEIDGSKVDDSEISEIDTWNDLKVSRWEHSIFDVIKIQSMRTQMKMRWLIWSVPPWRIANHLGNSALSTPRPCTCLEWLRKFGWGIKAHSLSETVL